MVKFNTLVLLFNYQLSSGQMVEIDVCTSVTYDRLTFMP